MTARAPLTASSLFVALNAIATAKTPEDCGQALTVGATLIQDAIAIRQSPAEVQSALESCPEELGAILAQVLDRAVSVHREDDGSALVLWLIPVVISAGEELASVIPLEEISLSGLKLAAYVQQQLALPAGQNGWVRALPALYHSDHLRTEDIGALIDLPNQMREVTQGARRTVALSEAHAVIEPGVALYYLPVIACHPTGTDISLPAASDQTTHRVTKWVTDSLQQHAVKDFAVHVAQAPRVFADAFTLGDCLRLDVEIRERITQVCDESGLQPNGLAALVAPYVTRSMKDGSFVLGVSLVSRLTTAFIATVALSVPGDEEDAMVSLVGRVLKDMGMQVVQMRHEAIETTSCQHCGHLQYLMPAVRSESGARTNGARAH